MVDAVKDNEAERREAMLARLSPDQLEVLEHLAGAMPAVEGLATGLMEPKPIRTEEARALLHAVTDAEGGKDAEEEDEVFTLADLKARYKTVVVVYPEHPTRLRIDYLPTVASDPSVAAKALRIVSIAKKLQDFETANPTAAKSVIARVDAGEVVTDAERAAAEEADRRTALEAIMDMDVEGFETLLVSLKSHMAEYLSLILSGWSLKEPPKPTVDALMEAGLGIMQDIFSAVRRKDAEKNGSGSA